MCGKCKEVQRGIQNNGLVIPLVFSILVMFAAVKVEKIKKENLKTHRQITDFIEGKFINEMKPSKKDKLVKTGIVLVSDLISSVLVSRNVCVWNQIL